MINLFKSEYKRIIYLKSSKMYFISIILISLVVSLLLLTSLNVTQNKTITEFASFDILSVSMYGLDVVAIMLTIFVAISLGKELNSKQLYFTIQTCPNRTKLFMIKMLFYFAISVVLSLIALILLIAMTQFALYINGMSLINFTYTENIRLIIATFIMPIFYTIVAVAFSFLLRSTGLTITSTFLLIALPSIFKLFGELIASIFVPLFPQSAIHSIGGVINSESLEYTSIPISILILVIWISLVVYLGSMRFTKDDF